MKINKKTQGKKNREAGARFELKVRKDLESKGWIVDKWSNTVELPKLKYKLKGQYLDTDFKFGKLIPAKRKYNPFKKVMAIGTGFPDFICFKIARGYMKKMYEIIGVEVKSNGYLTKEEKEKCKWLLDNQKFSEILIVSKGKKRGEIVYKEFSN